MSKLKSIALCLWKAFISIIRATLPQNRNEKKVFVFSFVFYLFLGCFWLFRKRSVKADLFVSQTACTIYFYN